MPTHTVDQLLEKFIPDYLDVSTSINALAQKCQPSIDSAAQLVTSFKATLVKHAYAKYISAQDQNFIFGARDLEKARNGSNDTVPS
jgi:hypothetical protein